ATRGTRGISAAGAESARLLTRPLFGGWWGGRSVGKVGTIDNVPAAGSSPRLVSTQLGTRHSRNGFYAISVEADHSGLMLASRTTLAHFSVSSAMSLPKSAGEP